MSSQGLLITPRKLVSEKMVANLARALMLVVLVVGIGAAVTFSLIISGSSLSVKSQLGSGASTVQCVPYTLSGPPSPKDAPVEGVEYLLTYNSTTGYVDNLLTMSSCEFLDGIANLGLSPQNVSAVADEMLRLQPGTSYLDVTSNSLLPEITTNGYLNAFYVNPQTGQLLLKSGITFSSNYTVAYYNGEQITNGTLVPMPPKSDSTP